MRRRLLFVIAALTMILSVFAPLASAGDVAASDFTVDTDGISLDSVYTRAAVVDRNGQKLVSVIVKLESDSLASYRGGLSGLPATSPTVTGDAKLDVDSLNARRYRAHLGREFDAFERTLKAALPGSEVTRRFDLIVGGVSALVPIDEVKTVENMAGVKAVYLDQMEQLVTDTSPEFIGVAGPGGAFESGYKGDGVVVGIIDSGIWPEHPSFSDPDPFGDAYPAPPAQSQGLPCEFGNTAFNPDDAPFTCNNKLIGAYNFNQTYEAVQGLIPTEFMSARDSNGHGTHTATTSAGNGGVQATLLGVDRGVVSGIAPRAHVIMYKGCGLDGCFSSDTSAAVQQAVADGVDVINYSISGGGDPYNDVVSLAFLNAFDAGVLVTPSAGNSGPGADTVAHREPWTLTVGASTSNRHFLSTGEFVGLPRDWESQISVVHGVPGLDVDVFVNGAETLPGFVPGDVAGPLDLAPGDYDIDVAPAGAGIDAAVLSTTAAVSDGMHATIVAHLAEDGTPMLSVFSNDTMPTAAGEGRISVRHTAAAPVVDVVLGDDTVLGTIANGEAFGMDVPAGIYDVYVTPTGGGVAGAVAGPIPLEVIAGTLRTVYAWGDLAGGSFALNIQDFAGFDAATESVGFTGASVTDGVADPTTTIMADAGDPLCLDDTGAFPYYEGKIIVCERGVIARVAKSFNVLQSGAAGMVLFNPTLQGLATDNHFIPSVHVENDAGADIVAFMGSHTGVSGTFTPGEATTVQGDVMAAFSSRGGTGQRLGISKPDVTAPGVQILAGHTPLPENQDGGLPGQLFQSIQGTSMSAPHTAGAAALVAGAQPDWSPAEIKSALMLTAITSGTTKEDGITPTDAFDLGSGRIDPTEAIGSGLVMDTAAIDYLTHADNLWNTNYPSVFVPVMPGTISTQRTFTNTGGSWTRWNVWSEGPSDLVIDVPRFFYARPNGSSTISIDLDASAVPQGETRFGWIYLSDGSQTLGVPVTIVRDQPGVTLDGSCESDELEIRDTMLCTIMVENTTLDDAAVDLSWRAPRELKLGDVYGARKVGSVKVKYADTLAGAEPPTPQIAADPGGTPGGGYLPLADFGVAPFGGNSDESIVNFNVPGFVYAGETYTQVGVVSNGYVVVGGGDGGDVDFINSPLPDSAQPNNTLAAFWTDLNPASGGNMYIGVLTGGGLSWLIVEFEDVPLWSDPTSANSFQVWIGLNGSEDITYTYGDVTGGDGGFLTVGAEDATGTRGDMIYFDGSGIAPEAGSEFRITSIPGSPGEVHVIEFEVEGKHAGMFRSLAEMTSDSFFGTSTAVIEGEVTGGVPPRVPPRR